jgi:DNA-binding MarR family transcriptional regulator
MTVSQAIALLHVALNEGMSVGDLAEKVRVGQSVMSRHLLDLGPFTRSKDPGANLVQHRMSATNMRVHEIVMTPKGAGLMRRIVKLLCR